MFDTITDILVTNFNADADALNPQTELEDVLQDSLDLVEFGAALAERTGTAVTDGQLAELRTLDDLAQLLEREGTTV